MSQPLPFSSVPIAPRTISVLRQKHQTQVTKTNQKSVNELKERKVIVHPPAWSMARQDRFNRRLHKPWQLEYIRSSQRVQRHSSAGQKFAQATGGALPRA